MKFGLFYANAGPFTAPDTFEALVRTAEEVGFESIWTVEHVVVPLGYRSQYPYTKDGRMPGRDDSPIADPLMSLAYAAALTEKLRLATGIVILPQRHPVYVAKEVATLDVLSRGRAILGVGIGWLEEEFDVIGVPFRERVARSEESVRAIRSLWSEAPESFAGDFFSWNPVESNPKPVQKPGVPIVIGGYVEAAARRAARIGDGFFPARGGFKTLPGLLQAMRDECGKIGRDPAEIEVTTGDNKLDLDVVRRRTDDRKGVADEAQATQRRTGHLSATRSIRNNLLYRPLVV
jgi:probable F420-dependent oxidoreductase